MVVSTQNPDLRLLPGMTANVTFQIERRENTLTVPNTALRFRPASARNERPAADRASDERPTPDPAAAPGRGRGEGRGEQMIENLKRELALTQEQEQQVRAIFREMGQKMRQMRESGAGQESFREEMAKMRRAAEDRIAAILTPDQKAKYDEMRGTASNDGPRRATVYVVGPNGEPKAVRVMVGITDGTNTELVSGEIKEGDQVIVGADSRPGARAGAPASPGRRFGL